MTRKDKVRLNLEVSPTVRDRLEYLQKESEAESMTEVIRRALAVYELLLAHRGAGGEVLLRSSGDPDRQLVLV